MMLTRVSPQQGSMEQLGKCVWGCSNNSLVAPLHPVASALHGSFH